MFEVGGLITCLWMVTSPPRVPANHIDTHTPGSPDHTHLVLQIVHGRQGHDDDDVLRLDIPENMVG